MIFQKLTKVRQNILLSLIFAMAIGLLIIILPNGSYGAFSAFVGATLILNAVYNLFKFLDSSRAFIHYLRLLISLFFGILGFAFVVYDGFLINMAAVVSALLPILSGILEIYLSLNIAKRAGRKTWWILDLFGIALILFGFSAATRPIFNDMTSYMRMVGGTLLFSSFVITLSLMWIWPNRNVSED